MGAKISGAIITGGENKRFGGLTKAKIVIGGKTIIFAQLEILEEIFDEIIIVTNTPEIYEEFNRHKIIGDLFRKAGPLGGLHAAMRASTGNAVFAFAGDMPFLNKNIIASQINKFLETKCDALVPLVSENPEPLHSLYSNSVLGYLENYLVDTRKYALRDFLKKIDTKYWEMEISDEVIRSFKNINSPSDLADTKLFPQA
jgi:molybdopterin-guanine dinucleotide biosynthesis protein A